MNDPVAKKKRSIPPYLRTIAWVVLVQLLLVNISAAIYAYRLTHFYTHPPETKPHRNFLQKTWALFTGPKIYKLSNEAMPSFPVDTVKLPLKNGDTMHCWYSAVPQSSNTVILFHGHSVNKSYVSDEAAVFRSWGYNVMLVDFRGHGLSGGRANSFGFDEVEEVHDAMEFARLKGGSSIVLYGVSLGAAASLKTVADGKAAPAAIIADMPFDNLHNHLKARSRVSGFPAEPYGVLVTGWIGLERGFNAYHHEVTRYASSVHCPVLLQWGARDPYISRTGIESIYSNLKGVKKLVVYDEAGHESLLHADPNKWHDEVSAFLKKLPTSGSSPVYR